MLFLVKSYIIPLTNEFKERRQMSPRTKLWATQHSKMKRAKKEPLRCREKPSRQGDQRSERKSESQGGGWPKSLTTDLKNHDLEKEKLGRTFGHIWNSERSEIRNEWWHDGFTEGRETFLRVVRKKYGEIGPYLEVFVFWDWRHTLFNMIIQMIRKTWVTS